MIKIEIMEPEDKNTPAPAETAVKKTRARKTAKPVAEKTGAPARKPRARKASKPENADVAAPVAAPAPVVGESAAPTETKPTDKKTKIRRVKTKQEPANEPVAVPAKETAAPMPAKETPAPAKEAPAEHTAPQPKKEIPTPAPKVEEFIPTPQQPRERELEPAPGFAVPETVGGNEGGGNGGKRRRRRNRNRRGGEGQSQAQQPAQPKVDPEELVRRAWKIFLGEVTEEGLALMDDRTAAEASRRAFRVAELFLLEASRHKPANTTPDQDESSAEDIPAPETAGE